jgi:hypothetical protein
LTHEQSGANPIPINTGRFPVTIAKLTLDDALDEIRQRKWTMHYFGKDARRPELIAATHRWPRRGCADVLILRSEQDATAYRVLLEQADDPLEPEVIVYFYQQSAIWTLRAILALPAPGHQDAPRCRMTPPLSCFIPPELERPRTIRPPL